MEIEKFEGPPPPPGVIRALTAGFNAVANRVWVILFPILLDVFLWLGPRLKVDVLARPYLQDMLSLQPAPSGGLMDLTAVQTMLAGLNVFSSLRTFPIGIFSLMAVNLSGDSPLGPRLDYQYHSLFLLFISSVLISMLGWLLGSAYFHAVAGVALPQASRPPLWRSLVQGFFLSGLLNLLATVLSVPVLFMMGILSLINQSLGVFAYFVLMIFVLWLALPVFFSGHGIFTDARNLFSSLGQGFRLVRYALPSMGWFAIIAVVISQGMDVLWRMAPPASWMAGVGIFGHAFISTSLLAASFIYYRDLHAWIDSALQWLKSQNISSARV